MSKTFKITTFLVFLVISIFFIFYCYSLKKDSLAIENPHKSEEPLNIASKMESEEKIKQEVEEAKEEVLTTPEEKEESEKNQKEVIDSIKINQKLVNWGYSSSKNRSINTVIIHSSYNALGGDYYSLSKLLEEYKEYGVSPHYLIDREGEIYQLVKDQNIAYHAGESKMPDGRSGVNDFSLGIELMNTESSNFTENQYQSLKKLISFLGEKHKITSVLGHDQISPGRKTDPWNFQWSKIK